jgi:hypothetical protein
MVQKSYHIRANNSTPLFAPRRLSGIPQNAEGDGSVICFVVTARSGAGCAMR